MLIGELPPTSPAGLREWAKRNGIPLAQAKERAVASVVLRCIAADAVLSGSLVFKGGNALRFVFGNPRSTLDLDFTVAADTLRDDETMLSAAITRAVAAAERKTGVKVRLQGIERRPKAATATMPTYALRLAYQFPGDARYLNFDQRQVIPTITWLEISFADLVCETISVGFGGTDEETLRVCSLDDIIAEKLRSLLQQPIRNRFRHQDVFDVARLAGRPPTGVDAAKIRDFFIRKCAARGIDPRRSSFNDEVRDRARRNYDTKIKEQAGDAFIPFDEAWPAVMELVGRLDLPA